jgi:Flp pilus assembly pilin Flp
MTDAYPNCIATAVPGFDMVRSGRVPSTIAARLPCLHEAIDRADRTGHVRETSSKDTSCPCWGCTQCAARTASGIRICFSLASRLWFEDDGQAIAEYAVMLAMILVLVVGTIRLVGTNANNAFSSVASSIHYHGWHTSDAESQALGHSIKWVTP